jgi:putative Mg2+ transporter-C (MgtC) family protein
MSSYPYEVHLLLRLLLAVACGAVLGYERERAGRSAGLRTNLLVCMGAALMMVVSKYFYYQSGEIPQNFSVGLDPSRIAAQIVTGIGFLGAGVIIKESGALVKGLTTAATLWFNAGVGMACGAGMIVLPIFCVIVGISALTILKKFEFKIPHTRYKTVHIDCSYTSEPILLVLKEHFLKHNMQIININFSQNFDQSTSGYDFMVKGIYGDEEMLLCVSQLSDYKFVRQMRLS